MAIDLVRRCTVFVAAALTAAVAVVAPVAVPTLSSGLPTASAACSDIEVVFARGTNDTPGLGRIGNAFVSSLRNKVGGRSVGAYAVNYPASFDFLAAAGGANDASGHIQWMVDNCPDTRLVLGGYSQGAAVIDVIAAVPFPAVGFNAPLPPNVPEHVAAVAVFGNPSAKLGLPLTSSPVYGSRAIDLCNPGDPVCGDGDSVPAHRAYEGPANDAANFVAGLL
ncbi:cutinase family protein [Mycolicibacterium boenickei]|uniref:Cutinase n=1 Tax=Mycolicibacterium boenickei TaxID=146017 RepID=A0AAX2ZTT0_9MYCO|nr:cutinase family protein [Mycolicibacterium boenickei]PEG62400.1 cutinase family protein [Mycolicibacterium boenickei]UNB98616.1 cutinase family protein [Mycolicibacterium boenickei]BBX94458.1 cutinase [Mycolicibacterium boenickei]